LSLNQLLADKDLELVSRSDITEEMDNRGGLVVATGKGNTAYVNPQRFARPRPCGHLKMLDQVSTAQRHLEWARPLTELIAITVATVEELAALLSDDVFSRSFQDGLRSPVAE
jgi:hypothetical protein